MVLAERTKRPGDVFIHFESPGYCTKNAIMRNPHTAAVQMTDMAGYPVVVGTNGAGYNLAMAGDEANVVGLIVDGEPDESIPAATNGTSKYQVCVNAPVIVNQTKLPTVDVNGDAFTVATIVTALEALKFEFRSEPPTSTTL